MTQPWRLLLATKVQSKRSQLFTRVLDWINSGAYDDQGDYILFGRDSIFDVIDELTDRNSPQDSDVKRTQQIFSDLVAEVGRREVSDRASIGKRPHVRKLRGLGKLSPEQTDLAERLIGVLKPRDPTEVIDAKYAQEIVAKLPKIVDRATRLSPHRVAADAISEPNVRRHFEEAHSCYFTVSTRHARLFAGRSWKPL